MMSWPFRDRRIGSCRGTSTAAGVAAAPVFRATLVTALVLLAASAAAVEVTICINYPLFETTPEGGKEHLGHQITSFAAASLLAIQHVNTRNCSVLQDAACDSLLKVKGKVGSKGFSLISGSTVRRSDQLESGFCIGKYLSLADIFSSQYCGIIGLTNNAWMASDDDDITTTPPWCDSDFSFGISDESFVPHLPVLACASEQMTTLPSSRSSWTRNHSCQPALSPQCIGAQPSTAVRGSLDL